MIPGLVRSPGEGNGNPLQYSCLENPMDGGAWWATVHGVSKSRTLLSDFTLTIASKYSNYAQYLTIPVGILLATLILGPPVATCCSAICLPHPLHPCPSRPPSPRPQQSNRPGSAPSRGGGAADAPGRRVHSAGARGRLGRLGLLPSPLPVLRPPLRLPPLPSPQVLIRGAG